MSRNEAFPPERGLYTIQHNECCNFVVGVSDGDEQVLMGVAPGHVVAVFFDKTGRFLRTEDRPVQYERKPGSTQQQQREERIKAAWQMVDAWKAELGLVQGEIRVGHFALPEWGDWGAGVGLFDLPQFMQDLLDDPSSEHDEQYRQEVLDGIEYFRRNGKYVLRWGTEYWMSKGGEITDT
jgi:hypothetical protein